MFTLDAHVCGHHRTVTAEADGFGGITVHTPDGPVHARNVPQAINAARAYMGNFLSSAERGGKPWGLRVEVAGAQAVYGEWPLLVGGGGGGPVTPIARIRGQYHEGSGPLAALENAVRILREYLSEAARPAAARRSRRAPAAPSALRPPARRCRWAPRKRISSGRFAQWAVAGSNRGPSCL